ncbi:MAG: DUF58 domain-containing protein [Planctomycetaceae bacterium]|nr:DUF58 domain-containing protein [Planctomycetaceae bacterium]
MSNATRSRIPISFSASSVLQFLGAIASFLAAWVLPLNFPEFGGNTSTILNIVGAAFLLIGIVNLFVGQRIVAMMQRAGMRSRVLLPREGIVYLGVMLMLAVAALLGHSNMLLLVFGMMAGPFVLNGWVVILMLQKVAVTRDAPESVSAGAVFSVQMTLSNGKRLMSSRLIEVRDVIEGSQVREEAEITFVRVPPRSVRTGSYQLQIRKRGIYRLGPIRVSSRFPLGIGERGMVVNDRTELIVHPAIGRLNPRWMKREREYAESINKSTSRRGIFDDEFHRIREFRTGDNPRSIHWRSSARRGMLLMREFEQQRESDMVVLLDLLDSQKLPFEESERAISLAATLCVEQTRRGSTGLFRLIIAGETVSSVQCPGASRFREAALNSLAITKTSPKASLELLFDSAEEDGGHGSERYLLITPRAGEAKELLANRTGSSSSRMGSILSRTTIIDAHREQLDEVFTLSEDDQ